MLEVKGLCKSFGALRASDGIDFNVAEGETHALIGPNGAGNLAHGEQRSLEVAMALATRPRLLLLDEPMAGMGADESQRMIGLLSSLKRRQTIVLVEHDMDAVFRLADRIAVLVYGRVIASDSPEKIKMNEEVRRAYLGEGA